MRVFSLTLFLSCDNFNSFFLVSHACYHVILCLIDSLNKYVRLKTLHTQITLTFMQICELVEYLSISVRHYFTFGLKTKLMGNKERSMAVNVIFQQNARYSPIDLFTDTAAILN